MYKDALAKAEGTICGPIDPLAGVVTQDLASEDGRVLGKALLCYDENMDETDIRLTCWGLQPGDYTVLLCECDDDGNVTDCIELGTFTTNETGSANMRARADGDVSNWCVVVGTVDDNGVVTPCSFDPSISRPMLETYYNLYIDL